VQAPYVTIVAISTAKVVPGVFIQGNTLTLLHPFFAPTLPHPIAYYRHKGDALIRDMHKMETQLHRHRDQNHVGRLVSKALHRLTTAR
jgi:hypothetical protein